MCYTGGILDVVSIFLPSRTLNRNLFQFSRISCIEETESGFSAQVPDLAIVIHGGTIDEAKSSAMKAISANLEAYEKAGQGVPERQGVLEHLEILSFCGLWKGKDEMPDGPFIPSKKLNWR